MARPTPPEHDVLADLNSYADHLRDWIAAHPKPVIAAGLVILGIAGLASATHWWVGNREERASAAIASVQRDYRAAMGAPSGGGDVPEPANPETARNARMEYGTRLLDAAREHEGSAAAELARLNAADLFEHAGASDRAQEAIDAALQGLGADSPIRGLALRRRAALLEAGGRHADAAAAYLEASEIPDFPLRTWSRADAARCFAEVGESERAAEIARALESESDTENLPPHLSQRLASLRAGAAAAPPAAPTP